MTGMSADTRAVHAGRRDLGGPATRWAHVPPIDRSSTSALPGVLAGGDAYETLATGGRPGPADSFVYQRLWNPTVARFEDAFAELEGAPEAVAFGSGMAAVSALLLACVQAGTPHVVAVRPLYGGTDHLLATGLLGTEVTWARPAEVAAAITPRTGIVLAETPANPTLDLVDIADLVRQARGVPVVIDNTFATPVLQNPLAHGAAMALHSLTKFVGGHGDLVGGAIAVDAAWARRLRGIRAITGGLLHPDAAHLAQRGLQTLPLRVRAQSEHATMIANWLAAQPAVARVHHPGIDDPQRICERQMSAPGAVLAFSLRGGYAEAAAVAERCRLITHAVSLGGVDSLIQHPAALTHRPVAAEARPDAGLLRLSVGLEESADVIADLEQALVGAVSAGQAPERPAARESRSAPGAGVPR